MRVPCAIAAVILCAALAHVPEALSQSSDPTIWVITSRGNLFEVIPLADVPTTDVVTSPYVEFQRIGGLVASAGSVREAAQYNVVGTGATYIVSNWGEGRTYGIPHGAPLGGEMRLSPVPHLHLRTPGTAWLDAISGVDVIEGSITSENLTDTSTVPARGEYWAFSGHGRAIVWLDTTNPHYSVNLVCPGCVTETSAVVGGIPGDGGGGPASTALGTHRVAHSTAAAPCTVDGVNHTGCGVVHTGRVNSTWPLDPRPPIGNVGNDADTRRQLLPLSPQLNFTRLDTATCPGATHTSTVMEPLDDTHFRAVSEGCVMSSYAYEWWDGAVNLTHYLPLRAGVSVWDLPSDDPDTGPYHPAIIIHLEGGEILLQAKTVPTRPHAETAYSNSLTINADHSVPSYSPMVDGNSLIILHDSFAHLAYYTGASGGAQLSQMVNHVQTYPQLDDDPGWTYLAHNYDYGASGVGGLTGRDCLPGYKYCITIFDRGDLPVVHNAAGVLYDPRNNAEVNRGSDVVNHANVFVSTLASPPVPATIEYDAGKLNLVQSYAVIPVSGHVSVEELYVMFGRGGGSGCDRYVDDTTDPHTWAAAAAPGWLRLKYLEADYGSGNNLIQVPLLPWYDTICMRTHGNDEFRQFRMDNFFRQGDSASYGGTGHLHIYGGGGALHSEPDRNGIQVLHTDVVLPGSGVRVLDMDLDLAGIVTLAGSVDGGGGATGTQHSACDWYDLSPPATSAPRHTPTQSVRMTVYVDISVPTVSGGYASIGGLSTTGSTILRSETPLLDDGVPRLGASYTPITVGGDCRHASQARWNADPEYRTVPIEYTSNTPIRITITADVDFEDMRVPQYAGRVPDETMYVMVILERLSLRVH